MDRWKDQENGKVNTVKGMEGRPALAWGGGGSAAAAGAAARTSAAHSGLRRARLEGDGGGWRLRQCSEALGNSTTGL